MIIIKNKQSITKMRVAGQALALIMDEVALSVRAGVSTLELDAQIERGMRAAGLVPSCKGYMGYRHASCISINDAVVHGVPSKDMILQKGDCVSIDIVGSYKGYHADMARSFVVESTTIEREKLLRIASEALDAGIAEVRPGVRLGVVSATIQKIVEDAGFGVLRDFVGHGIGKSLHEDPQVPNFGRGTEGPVLREGMTLAIEPMITEKDYAVSVMSDGWTVKTNDGGWAAHFEDTIAVTADGAEILTRRTQS